MSAVTGPISSMPNSTHSTPAGQMCDEHPTVPAVKRVQGETDSMGCEMIDMCQVCYDAHKNYMLNRDTSGHCDWCKCDKSIVRPHRDFEEGFAGRLYNVCTDCLKKESDSLEEDRASSDDRFVDYGDDFDDDFDDDVSPQIPAISR